MNARAPLAPLVLAALVLAAPGLAACAGSMAEISREDREREDSALLARGHHDDVVRLVGDADGPPVGPEGCHDGCPRLLRARDLSARICEIASNDDHDEATQFLCEDAGARTRGYEQRLAECSCGD